MNKPLNFRLYTLTPIHIGCDEVYEPTNFAIDEKTRKLIEFDQFDFVKSLSESDKNKLVKICEEGGLPSIIKLYNFVFNHKIAGRGIDIASGLISHYRDIRNLPTNNIKKLQNELNNFAIARTSYNPHKNSPYIPGSSIKGALRTAYLTKLALEKGIKEQLSDSKNGSKPLEEKLLGGRGSDGTDPFRMVKVSDFFSARNVSTKIVYTVNKEKNPTRKSDIYTILEIIKERAVFEGIISIESPLPNSGIKNPINQEVLLKALNDFYLKQWRADEKDLKKININTDKILLHTFSSECKDILGKSAFLIRIGRHSGAESVTIEGYRNIWIKPKKGKQTGCLDHATTIWLSSESKSPEVNDGLLPFGWALLEISDTNKSKVEPLLNKQPEISINAITSPPKPTQPVKSEFEVFKEQLSVLQIGGKDWGRMHDFVSQIKRMQNPENKRSAAQLLKNQIVKNRKKSKDYSKKTWYKELEEFCQ